MNILIKFTLKNMKENKFRLSLILISIALSTGLFYTSVAIGQNLESIFAKQMTTLVGDADIRIQTSGDYGSGSFYVRNFDQFREQTDYIYGGFFGNGTYESSEKVAVPLSLIGYDLVDLEVFNPIQLISRSEEDLIGKQVIIGQKFAKDQELGIGDSITIRAYGNHNYVFRVWGIAADTGLFQSSGEQFNILMPSNTASRMAGFPGKVNTLVMKSKEGNTLELIEEIKVELPGYRVSETVPRAQLKENIAQVASLFNMMLVLVILISIFIIYSSFKVIMLERIPVIGTFRSVGATKRATDAIMLGESFLYGLLGGLIGDGIGIGLLYGMTRVMAYDPYSKTTMPFTLNIRPSHLIMALLMSVVLSMVSSFIPILQVSKISVKDIVLNKTDKGRRKKGKKAYGGIVILFLAVIMPVVGVTKGNMILNVICMMSAVIGLIIMVPLIIKGVLRVSQGFVGLIFGNEGTIALKNINDNKSVINNIVLLTIGIASLFMINVISYSVGVEVIDVYNSAEFEVWSWVRGVSESDLQRVTALDGVTEAHGTYETRNIEVEGYEQNIMSLSGVNPYKYFDYWDYEILGDKETILSELDKGRHMILNKSMAEKYGVDVGDSLTLKLKGHYKAYKITGIVVTLMNNGQMAIISDKYFKSDLGNNGFSDIFLRTDGDATEVKDALIKKFENQGVWAQTMDSLQESNTQSNNQILILLKGFSVLTMVIGVFGIFNNYLVNMLSRRRPLAMYRSVGMSKKQMRKMLYIESLTGGTIGGVCGVLGGVIFIFMVGYVMRSMNLPVKMHIQSMMYIQSILGGVIVSVVASISPVIKSSKMQIIEAVKYE